MRRGSLTLLCLTAACTHAKSGPRESARLEPTTTATATADRGPPPNVPAGVAFGIDGGAPPRGGPEGASAHREDLVAGREGPMADRGNLMAGREDPADGRDPMAGHTTDTARLLRLFTLRDFADDERARRRPEAFLRAQFGDGPGRINHGNPALARHEVSRAQCLEGLRGVVLQTPEQRELCGADYMVPIYEGGRPENARACIDLFEFPNRPCELPVVWAAPSVAATVCSLQGKRLCDQEEWNLACRGDPRGGPASTYAYGDALDLAVCNTQKPHPRGTGGAFRCNPYTAQTTWNTCATETEPAGAFPRCRSRFGVFDQHGNVAEIMTRRDRDKGLVSQLKGSAFFYVDVYRSHDAPSATKREGRETYPDHCNYDPRWHVEPMSSALHVNYHLGFRCCKSLPQEAAGRTMSR